MYEERGDHGQFEKRQNGFQTENDHSRDKDALDDRVRSSLQTLDGEDIFIHVT